MDPGTGTISTTPGANPEADEPTVNDREEPSMNHIGEPALQEWAASARVEEAARRRRRLASWNLHGGDDATFEGVLADLAERRCEVMATLANGHHHRGAIIATPGAWSILVTPEGRRIAVRKRAILGIDCKELLRSFGDRTSFVTDPDELHIATAAHGEFAPRSAADATDRADAKDRAGSTDRMVIERLVGPGELVTLWSGLLMTHGELRSLSQDLAVVVGPEGARYVPLVGVDEVIGSNRS